MYRHWREKDPTPPRVLKEREKREERSLRANLIFREESRGDPREEAGGRLSLSYVSIYNISQ